MPFTVDDPSLPERIAKLSKPQREIWVSAFNSAFASYDPKSDQQFDKNKSEQQNREAFAFRIANAALQRANSQTQESLSWLSPFKLLESADGSIWKVVALRAGESLNGITYPAEVLKQSLELFDNLPVFAYEYKGKHFDHMHDRVQDQLQQKPAKNKVGVFAEPKWDEKYQGIVGKFHVMQSWLKDTLMTAWRKGFTNFLGFSIDGDGIVREAENSKRIAEKLLNMRELTVVSEPSAGGRLLSLAEAYKLQQNKKDDEVMIDKLKQRLAKIRESHPHLVEQVKDDMPAEKLLEAVIGAETAIAIDKAKLKKTDDPKPAPQLDVDAIAKAVRENVEAALQESNSKAKQLVTCRELLDAKLTESKLPDAAKVRIRESFSDRIFDEKDLNSSLEKEQTYIASLQESHVNVRGQHREDGKLDVKQGEQDRLQTSIELMLDGRETDDKGNVAFTSPHHAFRQITGSSGMPNEIATRLFQSVVTSIPPLDQDPDEWFARQKAIKIAESANKPKHLQEAEIKTTTFSTVFGNAMTKRLIAEYAQPNLQSYRQIATISSTNDFKTLQRMRVGGYANLATVAEGAAYPQVSNPSEDAVNFSVAKRGGLEVYTWEAALNDDLRALQRIPQKLGRSAAQTLHEFAYDFLKNGHSTATTDYDSTTLFHSNHSNTTTTALSATSLAAAVQAMRGQTDQDSSKPLGIRPRYLFVPVELEKTAKELLLSQVTLDSNRNETVDNLYLKGYGIIPVVVDYWTDNNNWYLAADKRSAEGLEIVFLNGRQRPELFIQDQPTNGSVFTADKITWKIRFVFGGDLLDHRAFYGANVA